MKTLRKENNNLYVVPETFLHGFKASFQNNSTTWQCENDYLNKRALKSKTATQSSCEIVLLLFLLNWKPTGVAFTATSKQKEGLLLLTPFSGHVHLWVHLFFKCEKSEYLCKMLWTQLTLYYGVGLNLYGKVPHRLTCGKPAVHLEELCEACWITRILAY